MTGETSLPSKIYRFSYSYVTRSPVKSLGVSLITSEQSYLSRISHPRLGNNLHGLK